MGEENGNFYQNINPRFFFNQGTHSPVRHAPQRTIRVPGTFKESTPWRKNMNVSV